MAALFSKMRAIYGKKWTDIYSDGQLDAALEEWAIGLRTMTGEQIAAGLDYCRESLDWPPSIAEFLKVGRSQSKEQDMYKALPRSLPVSKEGREKLSKIISETSGKVKKGKAGGRRTNANIASGEWTEKDEIGFQQSAKMAGIDVGNPINLQLFKI